MAATTYTFDVFGLPGQTEAFVSPHDADASGSVESISLEQFESIEAIAVDGFYRVTVASEDNDPLLGVWRIKLGDPSGFAGNQLYEVTADKIAYRLTDADVPKSAGGSDTLTGPHHVQITIVDDVTDEAIALADVRMKRPGESGRDTTDGDGLAEFACESAMWTALVRASGYEGAVRTVEVDGDTEEEIRLTPIVLDVNDDPELCSFRIRFIRVDGSPIVGAAVRAVLSRERQCFDGGIATRLDEDAEDPVTDGNGWVTLLLVQGMQVYFTLDGVAEKTRSIVTVPNEANAGMLCQR